MENKDRIKQYYSWQDRCNSYGIALGTLSFERQTFAPSQGREYSSRMQSILSGELYKVATDQNEIDNMQALVDSKELDFDLAVELQQRLKDISDLSCIPPQEYMDYNMLKGQANMQWEKSKIDNDYQSFKPYLIKMVEMTKKMIAYRDEDKDIYDTLLDDYEKGMNMDKYDRFFDEIEQSLIPFIKKVCDSEIYKQQNDAKMPLAIVDQEKITAQILKYLNYDNSWGYLTTSAHPFSTTMSIGDCRITTHYNQDDFTSNIYSIIHEVGHATYNHQVSSKYEGRAIRHMIGSGMHESQSRLLENYIGRRQAFWINNLPTVQKYADYTSAWNVSDMYKLVNMVQPSLIRTDADELTYPIHLLIRYKLEREMFAGDFDFDDLPNKWNQLYKQYLNVDVPNDTKGLLQDVHWSYGYFGYFPTYALGSAYAAQFMNKMEADIDVDGALANERVIEILDWLKLNIHQYGGLYTADQLLQKITGETFNAKYYTEYLISKYSEIYNIEN